MTLDEEWELAGPDLREIVKRDVHSSMAPIRVEINREDASTGGAAMPWEGAE